jgi:hypothetical protein
MYGIVVEADVKNIHMPCPNAKLVEAIFTASG